MSFSRRAAQPFENPVDRETDRVLPAGVGALRSNGSEDTGQDHASEEDPDL